MAKQLIANSHATLSIEHRAKCTEGDFTGSWHDDVEDAFAEAAQHRQQPGCQDHVIKIITRQTSELLFMPNEDM